MRETETTELEPKTSIYMSIKGIQAEIANLTTARVKLEALLADDPDLIVDTGRDRLSSLQNMNNCKQVAIALTFARRLIKYGLLPDTILPPFLKKQFGFEDWLEYCRTSSGRDKDFSAKERKLLVNAYESDNLAVKNLRRTLWSEVFYNIVGIDPQRDHIFYMHYYLPALDDNREYTITFNEPRTLNINPAATTACLRTLFNQAPQPLRSV